MSLLRRIIEQPQRRAGWPRYLGVPVGEETFQKHILFYDLLRKRGFEMSHHGYVWANEAPGTHVLSPFLLFYHQPAYQKFNSSGEVDGKIIYADTGIVERVSGEVSDYGVDLREQGLDEIGAVWTQETESWVLRDDFRGSITDRQFAGLRLPGNAYEGVVVDSESVYPSTSKLAPFPRRQGHFYMEPIPRPKSFLDELIGMFQETG